MKGRCDSSGIIYETPYLGTPGGVRRCAGRLGGTAIQHRSQDLHYGVPAYMCGPSGPQVAAPGHGYVMPAPKCGPCRLAWGRRSYTRHKRAAVREGSLHHVALPLRFGLGAYYTRHPHF